MAQPLKIRVEKAVRDLLKIQYEEDKLARSFDDIGFDVSARIYPILETSPLDVALDLLGVWQDNTIMFDLPSIVPSDATAELPPGCFSRDYFFEEFIEKVDGSDDPELAIAKFIADCQDVVRRYIEDENKESPDA